MCIRDRERPVKGPAARTLGDALMPALAGMLVLWTVVPLSVALLIFNRRSIV